MESIESTRDETEVQNKRTKLSSCFSKMDLESIRSSSALFRIQMKNVLSDRGYPNKTAQEDDQDPWERETRINEWFRTLIEKRDSERSVSASPWSYLQAPVTTNSQEWIEFEKEDDSNLRLYSRKVTDTKDGCFSKEFSDDWNLLAFFVWDHSLQEQSSCLEAQIIVDMLLEHVDKFKIFSIDRSKSHSNLCKVWSLFQLYMTDLFASKKNHHLEDVINKIDHHIKAQIRPIHYFWKEGKLGHRFSHSSMWL